MKRRKFLAALAVLALAGCSEDGTETIDTTVPSETTSADVETTTSAASMTPINTDTTSGTQSPAEGAPETTTTEIETRTETSTPTDTETRTPTSEADVTIGSTELVTKEDDFFTRKWVAATVTNEGDAASGQITLTVEWYDSEGNYLTDTNEYLESLGPGETWAARVEKLTDVEEVADYEISGEYETDPLQPPDGVELVKSELQIGEEPQISGEVANTTEESLDYIEAIGKLYDGDGVVLGSEYTNETDIPADTNWAFTLEWLVFDRTDQVEDHKVLLDGSPF